MAFGVTEPNAGTDTSRIQTRAEKQGDRWIVNGRKVWTTNAQHATKILLLARTARARSRQAAQGHDALLHRRSTARRSRVRVIDKLGPGRGGLQRDLHRRPRDPRRGRGGRGGRRLLPPARLPQPRAHLHRHRGGRHRPGRARPRRAVRQGARRLRPAHRQEPGHRAPAGACAGQARGGRADVPQGGLALRPRPAVRGARPTPPSCSRRRPASRPATPRCRPSAASATPRSSTSSGCGARSGSTRSRRSPSRWRSTTSPSTCSACRGRTSRLAARRARGRRADLDEPRLRLHLDGRVVDAEARVQEHVERRRGSGRPGRRARP